MTGGAQATNGPKNGIAMRTPARGRRDREVREAEHGARQGRDRRVDDAEDRLAAEEAAERPGDAALEQAGLLLRPGGTSRKRNDRIASRSTTM